MMCYAEIVVGRTYLISYGGGDFEFYATEKVAWPETGVLEIVGIDLGRGETVVFRDTKYFVSEVNIPRKPIDETRAT